MNLVKFWEKQDIGNEAEEWISSHLGECAPSGSGVRNPRVFVGEWNQEWGNMAPTQPSISMLCVDIPVGGSISSAGKGKGAPSTPLPRLYIGDRDGLYKPSVSLDDIEEMLKKNRRVRKPSAKARGDGSPR